VDLRGLLLRGGMGRGKDRRRKSMTSRSQVVSLRSRAWMREWLVKAVVA